MKFSLALIITLFTFISINAQNSEGTQLVCTNTNVLYVGVYNPITISTTDSSESYTLTSSRMVFKPGKTKYDFLVFPKAATNKLGAPIYVINSKGDTVATQRVLVKRLPDSQTSLLGVSQGLMTKEKLQTASKLESELKYFPLEPTTKVLRFVMTIYSENSPSISFVANSNKFTPEMKNAINNLKLGDIIIFNEIKTKVGASTRLGSVILIIVK